MFINDLIDSFLKYERKKKILGTLANRQEAALAAMNKPVTIRDLVVRTQAPNCYGESKSHTNPYNNIADIERLNDHIHSLFTLANEDHRANYCQRETDGTFNIKEGKENCITRLTMNEFSLYTENPLSIHDFKQLLIKIETMAHELGPNVHVLLSSFAVKVGDKVANMSVFIEGGRYPNIHSFAKNTASMVDIDYKRQEQLFSQQERGVRGTHHADVSADENGLLINTGSVFEVTTAGGATYTQAVDVCLDHALGHSKALIERKILGEESPDELIPEQIEQCVTSNWIDLHQKSTIASVVLHADPVRSMHEFHQHALGARSLTAEGLERVKSTKYTSMGINPSTTGYEIVNPPFGSNCTVDILLERPAAKHLPSIQSAIKQHNNSVLSRVQGNAWASTEEDKTLYHASKSDVILTRMEELEKKMLNKCRPGFWQRLFKTEEYRQKMEAKTIIQNSFDLMRPNFQGQGAEKIFLIKPWKKDLLCRLHHMASPNTSSSLLKNLTQEITQQIDKKLKQDLNCQLTEDTSAEHVTAKL